MYVRDVCMLYVWLWAVGRFWSYDGQASVPANIFWFGKQWRSFRHRDAQLTYDNHFLHAMCAPRGAQQAPSDRGHCFHRLEHVYAETLCRCIHILRTRASGLLLTEAYEDFGANPPGTYAAAQAAREVFCLLDAEHKLGWAWREGVHSHASDDYAALLDFMDRQFRNEREWPHKRDGDRPARDFQRQLYPNLHELLRPGPGGVSVF
jgi:hypothetical protein